MTEQATALRYLGGAFIHGVPARDLTADEAAQYADVIKEQQELTGAMLYEPVKAAKAATPKAKEE